MATEINVNVKDVIKNNRTPLSNFAGSVFAQDLFKPQTRVYDVDYQQKIDEVKNAGNRDLVLNRSPRRFSIYGITISKIELGTNINDEVVLIINKGLTDEIEVPYTCDKDFGSTEEEIVKDAIKNPDKNLVFSDPKKLATWINKLNNSEISRIDNLIKVLQTAKKQCESAISDVNDKVNTYFAQKAKSAQKMPGDVSAQVNVSVE
jgi:hypothetical protein